MADQRDEREGKEGESKIKVVDRRMLSEEERAGKGPARAGVVGESGSGAPPKLEIVGGYAAKSAQSTDQPAPDDRPASGGDTDSTISEPATGPRQPAPMGEPEDEDQEPLSAEEQERLVSEVEQEHFAEIERQMGRPLTEQEKDAVRAEMERQAQSMASLEVTPLLQQFLAEMSARAAVHMGLMPNPYTRLVAKNDTQARLAIDAFAAVVEVLRPHMDAASQREYMRVLNDLRVNFVSATGIPAGGMPLGGMPPGGPSKLIH
jgi:Domain of unknown function (DUF1844)